MHVENNSLYSFVFSDSLKSFLGDNLEKIAISPYSQYEDFMLRVNELITEGKVPDEFIQACENKNCENEYDSPYTIFKNCPIDLELPYLSFHNPVEEKRSNKKTFVAEAFLALSAILLRQQPIGYMNVNNGDVFQDIHPKEDLQNSQSQKAVNAIYFHKDLANHFVRPDWVNILGLRNNEQNKIYTCFAKNRDILELLSTETKATLAEPLYYTPFDDLSVHKSVITLGEADIHPILGGVKPTDIRFFENRTRGTNEYGDRAIAELRRALHAVKTPVFIAPGLFMGAANNDCLHNKEIHEINEANDLKNRWLMKTVNVRDLSEHQQHFVQGKNNIVAG
ncbi:TPA: hypothetical protein ACSTJY_003856 [Serratia fonticola]